jgi:hypothetical protein
MSPQRNSTISPLVLHGRIAFASFLPGGLVVDCVIGTRSSSDVDGIVTLTAVLPYSPWALAAAGLIEIWADADTPVELRFNYSKPNTQVRITDGRSLVLLDLQNPPTVRLGPDHDSQPPICA